MSRPRRVIAGALAAVVLVTVGGLPAAADSAPTPARPTLQACPIGEVSTTADTGYRDIGGYPFAREINCLTDYGVARGRAQGSYEPVKAVPRRQMALFLTRIVSHAGRPLPTADAGFGDLGGLDPATRDAVNAVTNLGIARGTAPGRYSPDAPVTRAQMATFLDNLHLVLTGARFPSDRDHFDGDAGVHEASTNGIASAGIGVGTAEREFSPLRPVTRGQMAGFLGRLLDVEVAGSTLRPVHSPTERHDATGGPLSASGVPCTVLGTEGDDVLQGTTGRDVLCGGGGDDLLEALDGDDVVDGGAGVDRLLGGPGDDDLDGGPDGDLLDGGAGTNWCVPAVDDLLEGCRYDLDRPVVEYASVVPEAVDVDAGDVPVVALVRLLDDTGVASADVSLVDPGTGQGGAFLGRASLVAGTVQDGLWEVAGPVRQYSAGGRFAVQVHATDRLGRTQTGTFPGAVRVTSTTVDRELPVVRSIAVTSSTGAFPLDVRERAGHVEVRVHVTDDLAGVEHAVHVCPWVRESHDPGPHPTGDCAWLGRSSGTARDGVYEGVLHIPRHSVTGGWSLAVSASDTVASGGQHVRWVDRQVYDYVYDKSGLRMLTDEGGRFAVVGVTSDQTAPSVVETQLTPTTVDTLRADQTVEVLVHAVDQGPDGVWQVGAWLHGSTADGSSVNLPAAQTTQRLSGTALDGWWRLELVLPRGTPPGTYHLLAWVEDTRQRQSFVSPGSPYADGNCCQQPLPAPATVTVVPHGD